MSGRKRDVRYWVFPYIMLVLGGMGHVGKKLGVWTSLVKFVATA